MKKGWLLLILVLLLLQATFIIWMNSGSFESLRKDPWTVAGLAEDVEVQEVKAAEPAPYPGPKATNPSMGQGLIRGRVVDATGEPQANVAVVADHHRDGATSLSAGVRQSARWATETDDAGFFTFATLPGGLLTVSAYTPLQHAMAEVTLEEEGAAGEVFLTLKDTVQLGGTVFTPEGMALQNAWVYPVACDTHPGPLPYARLPEKTDKEGRFDFSHLCAGNWRLLVASRQYAPFLSPDTDPAGGDVELNLRAGATLLGTVTEVTSDRPEGRVEIFAREMAYGLETYRTRTDGRGHFELTGLRGADYSLTLSASRVAPIYSPIQTTVKPAEVSELPPIWVKPAGSLRGRVLLTGGDGRGVSETMVHVMQAGQVAEDAATVRTDMGGYYLFNGLAEGPCEVHVVPPVGYAPTDSLHHQVNITAGQQAVGPSFVLERGLTVSGRVEDGDGIPVAQANVHLTAEGRLGAPMATRTNDSGMFAFDSVGGGESVTLQAQRMDRESPAAGPFAMNGEALTGLVLKLENPRVWATPAGR